MNFKTLCTLSALLLVNGCSLLNPPQQPETNPQISPITQTEASQRENNIDRADSADYPAQLFYSMLANEGPQLPADDSMLDSTASAEPDSDTQTPDDAELADNTEDVWQRIRDGFSMELREHKRIEQQLNWYKRHPEYFQRVAERARPYLYYIVEELEKNDIPMELALLPIVESAFKPFAYSHGRASGIWQFIPSTGRRFGLKQNWWYDGRRDVYAATQSAINLLKRLHEEFDGDWLHALAAYNSGGGNVRRAIRRNKKRGKTTDFFALHLPRETRAYVPKLLALKQLVADPQQYGIQLTAIPNTQYFEKVDVDSQIDLALASELSGLPIETIYQLNPGYNRWATSPDGPHHLLLPLENAETFKSKLAEYPAEKRIRWMRHRIRKGETLSSIASKFHTSISVIKQVNRIKGTRLRTGHSLMIPVARNNLSSYKLSSSQRKRTQQNIPRNGTKVKYIVKPGDTLWDLARRHGVGVRQLAKWNSMAPRDPLVPGQQLIIWSRKQTAAHAVYEPEYTLPPRRSITQRIGYRVRPGDSFARISQKFNVTIAQLKRWNKRLAKRKYLQPGQRVTLYVDVTRTSGST